MDDLAILTALLDAATAVLDSKSAANNETLRRVVKACAVWVSREIDITTKA